MAGDILRMDDEKRLRVFFKPEDIERIKNGTPRRTWKEEVRAAVGERIIGLFFPPRTDDR